MKVWVVDEVGTLLEYLFAQFQGDYSKKKIKGMLDKGLCRLNGKVERFCKTEICPGDKVVLKEESTTSKECPVIYEDDYFLVVNKARGVVCHESSFPGFELIHRLDKDTAGVLLLAKSLETKTKMVKLFQTKNIKKRYVATVKGVLKEDKGTLTTKLSQAYGEGSAKRYRVSDEGKSAITKWEVVKRGKGETTLYLYPVTGRTHQLRVHMAHLGHPIIGDVIYGREAPGEHLHLTAECVEFTHPYHSKAIKIDLPV